MKNRRPGPTACGSLHCTFLNPRLLYSAPDADDVGQLAHPSRTVTRARSDMRRLALSDQPVSGLRRGQIVRAIDGGEKQMKRSRICLLAVAATCVLAAGVSTTPAGAAPSTNGTDRAEVPTFKEFAASTYRDFDGQYIVNGDEAIKNREALWESATSGVNFTHVSSGDSNCRTSNNAVLFSVEPTSTTQYIARAFFPSSSDSQRRTGQRVVADELRLLDARQHPGSRAGC